MVIMDIVLLFSTFEQDDDLIPKVLNSTLKYIWIKVSIKPIYLKFMRFVENYEKEWYKFGVLPEIPACLTQ